MDKKTLEHYRKIGLSYRAISTITGMSYTNVRHWVLKHGLRSNRVEKEKISSRICGYCRKSFFPSKNTQKKFCSALCSSKCRPKADLQSVCTTESTYCRGSLKRRLIQEKVLKNECAICGLSAEWNGFKLVLILDHVNGVKNDHRFENLRLLCPNCNSQQSTFSGRNTQRAKEKFGRVA